MPFSSRIDFYQKLGRLMGTLTGDAFWPALCEFLDSECALDEFAVFHYVSSEAPKRLFDLRPSDERDHLHGELLKAAYLIGPYYNNVVKAQAGDGFYHIDAIAPDAFRESEYYRIYYRAKHASDEGMFYIPIEPGNSVGLLAERREPSPRFTTAELEQQQALVPFISALVRRRWKLVEARGNKRNAVGEQMVTALECFGRDVLSDREQEIAGLILRGHSSKSGARELGISPETERVHRKRLYGKLGVSSQSELFWLFIQSVQHFDPERRNDPLQIVLANRD